MQIPKQVSHGAQPGLESLVPAGFSEGKSQNRSRTRGGESLEAGLVPTGPQTDLRQSQRGLFLFWLDLNVIS